MKTVTDLSTLPGATIVSPMEMNKIDFSIGLHSRYVNSSQES